MNGSWSQWVWIKRLQTPTTTRQRYLSNSGWRLITSVSPHLLLQPVQAWQSTIMMLNMVFFYVYRGSLPLPPTPPHPPSEWGASGELPKERMCVFQKPLSLRIASFPSPPFGLDVRFQHTADLLLFFTSILAVAVSQVVNSLLQIHSRGGLQRAF